MNAPLSTKARGAGGRRGSIIARLSRALPKEKAPPAEGARMQPSPSAPALSRPPTGGAAQQPPLGGSSAAVGQRPPSLEPIPNAPTCAPMRHSFEERKPLLRALRRRLVVLKLSRVASGEVPSTLAHALTQEQ